MFKPVKGRVYISDVSDLKVKILDIIKETSETVTASMVITNKRNGIFYEAMTRELKLDNIQHWKEDKVILPLCSVLPCPPLIAFME